MEIVRFYRFLQWNFIVYLISFWTKNNYMGFEGVMILHFLLNFSILIINCIFTILNIDLYTGGVILVTFFCTSFSLSHKHNTFYAIETLCFFGK